MTGVGWLIERFNKKLGCAEWLYIDGPQSLGWDDNSFLALRFSRQCDAEKVIELLDLDIEADFNAMAIEHMWSDH